MLSSSLSLLNRPYTQYVSKINFKSCYDKDDFHICFMNLFISYFVLSASGTSTMADATAREVNHVRVKKL